MRFPLRLFQSVLLIGTGLRIRLQSPQYQPGVVKQIPLRPRLVVVHPGSIGALLFDECLRDAADTAIRISEMAQNPQNHARDTVVPLLTDGQPDLPIHIDPVLEQLAAARERRRMGRQTELLQQQQRIGRRNPFFDIELPGPFSVRVLAVQDLPPPALDADLLPFPFQAIGIAAQQIAHDLPADRRVAGQ